MTSPISNCGGASAAMSLMQPKQRPNASTLTDQIFSNVDTTGKGYIDKADLQAALSKTESGSSSSTSSADSLFKALDSDGNGQITKQEMSSSINSLANALDTQFNTMRANRGAPPPPPHGGRPHDNDGDDGSATKASSTSSSSSSKTYDPADLNRDGKVSAEELVLKQVMQLTQTYGTTATSPTQSNSTGNNISISA